MFVERLPLYSDNRQQALKELGEDLSEEQKIQDFPNSGFFTIKTQSTKEVMLNGHPALEQEIDTTPPSFPFGEYCASKGTRLVVLATHWPKVKNVYVFEGSYCTVNASTYRPLVRKALDSFNPVP